jgi:hypothetical protein
VVWFTRASDKRAFGDLIVRATETIIADRQQAIDDFAWYRGTWGEIQSKKDGVTPDAAGLPPLIRTLAKLIPASRPQNDDSWLKATRDTQVPTAAAFGTLVVRDPLDPVQRLQAGRIWQRMHLGDHEGPGHAAPEPDRGADGPGAVRRAHSSVHGRKGQDAPAWMAPGLLLSDRVPHHRGAAEPAAPRRGGRAALRHEGASDDR